MGKIKKQPNYEEAAARLEEIVDAIDGGTLALNETVNAYKEGMELAAFCAETLQKAEADIFELRKNAEGGYELITKD